MGDGFSVAVEDLRDAANGPLASLEETLLWTRLQLWNRAKPDGEGIDESGEFAQTWDAFLEHCYAIMARQAKGADAIAATAEALKSIATLYAKADGAE